VIVKNAGFWNVTPLGSYKKRRCQRFYLADSFHPDDGGETSVITRGTRRKIPEDGFFVVTAVKTLNLHSINRMGPVAET
jgi:hypothetical protein